MTDVNLEQLLTLKQEAMATSLGLSDAFAHPGAKGDVTEDQWQKVIEEFLPRRYTVSAQSFVLDCDGERSDNIDLIVHDAHFCPLFFEEGGHRYIPAESVYAVFEIKPELDRGHVLYAADKAASVRKLRRTTTEIRHAGGTYGAPSPEDLFTPLAGILTSRSDWAEPFGKPFIKALGDTDVFGRLDLGCALAHGSFDVTYPEDGPIISTSTQDASLIYLLVQLFARLQRMGTVAAIDFGQYVKGVQLA